MCIKGSLLFLPDLFIYCEAFGNLDIDSIRQACFYLPLFKLPVAFEKGLKRKKRPLEFSRGRF
ncbi:hypothetical protein D770_22980 [Flammeovirgaceae bacterium 311]|nr:hypothetical protein D770_22980 [Flammeovirgaceae bacterium 311]